MEMYNVDDIKKLCNCSKAKAYNIIRALNESLIKKGTPKESIISGKVSKKLFEEMLQI